MSVKTKIRRLEAAGVDETLIVKALEPELHKEYPYKEVRGNLRHAPERLSRGARLEIRMLTSYEHTPAELQRMYRTTSQEVYKAKHCGDAAKERPDAPLVLDTYHRLGSITATLQDLNTSKRHVTLVLREAGLITKSTTHDTEAILRLLRGGATHVQITEALGSHVGVIGRIARANGLGRQKQRQNMDNWPEILEYAEEHNVSEAARKFNVERSNIYYHRNKES